MRRLIGQPQHHHPGSPGDEEGTLIVAIPIIFIVVLVTAAAVTSYIGESGTVLTHQGQSQGLALADAALSDAMFQLDQYTTDPGAGSYFYVADTSSCASDTAHCIGTTIPGIAATIPAGSTYSVSYEATEISSTKWTIKAKGMVNGSYGAVQETMSRTADWPFALFGNQGLTFDGNASGNGSDPDAFGTYDPTQTQSSSNPDQNASDCNPSGTPSVTISCVSIGSNGTIDCKGGLASNVTAVYFSGGGGISNKCGPGQPITNKYPLAIPALSDAGSNPQNCPNGGSIGSNVSIPAGSTVPGVNAPLGGGTYLCYDQELKVNGTVTVATGAQAKIYIILDSATDTSFKNHSPKAIPTMYIAGASKVNTSFDGTNGTPSGATLPDATQLQVYSNSSGVMGDYNGDGAYTFSGLLDAPNASLTGDGCKSAYYGALIINTLTCNGGPHLKVLYDKKLKDLYGDWGVSGYTQINPGFSIP